MVHRLVGPVDGLVHIPIIRWWIGRGSVIGIMWWVGVGRAIEMAMVVVAAVVVVR